MAQSMAPTCPRGSISETATTLHREMMPTTERSIKPPMMTNDMPNATNGSGQSWRSTFVRLEALANFGSTMAVDHDQEHDDDEHKVVGYDPGNGLVLFDGQF